jgi:hypothetical protein
MLMVDQDTAGGAHADLQYLMISIAYEGTTGVNRLRDRAEVQIFTGPFWRSGGAP